MINCIFLFCLLSIAVFSAEDQRESYAGALAFDKEKDEPLNLVFADSYWCEASLKSGKKVGQFEEFKEYSKKDYMLYMANFPRMRVHKFVKSFAAKNDKLSEKYGLNGHFSIALASDKGILSKSRNRYTFAMYIANLNTFLK